VFALHVRAEPSSTGGPMACAVVRDAPSLGERTRLFVSAGDGSWRATTEPPPGSWLSFEFGDRAWTPLSVAERLPEGLPDGVSWRYEALQREGAQLLLLPAREVWVRRRFRVERGMARAP